MLKAKEQMQNESAELSQVETLDAEQLAAVTGGIPMQPLGDADDGK